MVTAVPARKIMCLSRRSVCPTEASAARRARTIGGGHQSRSFARPSTLARSPWGSRGVSLAAGRSREPRRHRVRRLVSVGARFRTIAQVARDPRRQYMENRLRLHAEIADAEVTHKLAGEGGKRQVEGGGWLVLASWRWRDSAPEPDRDYAAESRSARVLGERNRTGLSRGRARASNNLTIRFIWSENA